MDHLQQLRHHVHQYLFGMMFSYNAVLLLAGLAAVQYHVLNFITVFIICLVALCLGNFLLARWVTSYALEPLQAIWQAILHLSPSEHGTTAPNIENLRVGRELVTSLTAQVYQLASVAERASEAEHERRVNIKNNFVAQNLPLPLLVLDATETITFANETAASYIGIAVADIIGKNAYMVLDMSFPSEATFDTWLKDVKVKNATATGSWERVRLNVRDNHPTRLFDLAAYYNRDNPDKIETMLVLFDHTKQYSQEDQAVSFMALSVHELRTPLTLLRSYIEVFEDELGDQLDAEMHDFMLKMRAVAEQLTAFVNNILNVARVDDDQLELQLQAEDWSTVLKNAIEGISLRAKVRGVTLKCSIAGGLPSVGVDRLSITEVVNNLIDNAIKYSGSSKVIEINAHLSPEGLVETTFKDYGLGISGSIMPNLFTKFYRDHRNRSQIGGTGLGLYLSKAIVTAHGGSLWVRSKENEGSTFGFTLVPYTRLADELKRNGNGEMTRGAHGWIKNHSLYRR